MKFSQLPLPAKFCKLTENDIFDLFCRQKSAYIDGSQDKKFVYIPGTRDDRVLLVAHADTVWKDQQIKLKIENGFVKSDQKSVGIGADDRAGIAILWCLKNSGHSILITSGEESGCKTARWLADDPWWSNELNKNHSFFLEFDRKYKKEIVFYESGTKDFAKYLKENTGFEPSTGGYGSDVKYFAKDVCAANLSVGYYNPHAETEVLDIEEWQNCLLIANEFLKQQQKRFNLDKSSLWKPSYQNQGYTSNFSPPASQSSQAQIPASEKTVLICEYCEAEITEDIFFKNAMTCPYCNRL